MKYLIVVVLLVGCASKPSLHERLNAQIGKPISVVIDERGLPYKVMEFNGDKIYEYRLDRDMNDLSGCIIDYTVNSGVIKAVLHHGWCQGQ